MSNKYLDFALKEIVNHEVNKVLDKIRAEIKEHQRTMMPVIPVQEVFEIIDKYRGESEV